MTAQNMLIGMAGQLRVASELLLRGHKPALGFVDDGTDLILDNGIRIQVKTASLCEDKGQRNRRYHFVFKHWKKKRPHGLANVDFVICWALGTDSFWIMPAKLICNMSTFAITPEAKGYSERRGFQVESYLNAWQLLKEVMPVTGDPYHREPFNLGQPWAFTEPG